MSDSATLEPPPQDAEERQPVTKKEITADHPTWCPGCRTSPYCNLQADPEAEHLPREGDHRAGIGCSSRFPYFVQAHGAHYIHGRALSFASGVPLSCPDLHVFAFGGTVMPFHRR